MRAVVVLLVLAAPLAAQWQCSAGGTYKNLSVVSRSYFGPESYVDSLNRLRVTAQADWRDWLSFHVETDQQAHAGTDIGLRDFDTVTGRADGAYLDLLHTYTRRRYFYADGSIYRGTVSLRSDHLHLTVGRQRIAWGTARFWSPADQFNPISPLVIDQDFRQGVDAAQLEWAPAGRWRWTAVYAPQNGFARSTSALRVSTTAGTYDLNAFAVRAGHDWTGGGSAAGQWKGAGVHGEATYRWRRDGPEGNALRLSVGMDSALGARWYVAGEYFYNQGQPPAGRDGAPDLAVLLRPSTELFTLRRHFASAGSTYQITPLLQAALYAVADVAGHGVFLNPRLSYSLSANADVTLGGQMFASGTASEFQAAPGSVYVELLYHFPDWHGRQKSGSTP